MEKIAFQVNLAEPMSGFAAVRKGVSLIELTSMSCPAIVRLSTMKAWISAESLMVDYLID